VNERHSFFEDDDDDTLLFERIQEHVLEQHPNPERVGCIDHATLEAWVYSPEKLDLSDPKYLHVLKCAECTRELIDLRKRRNEERGPLGIPAGALETKSLSIWRWTGIAAVLIGCLALGGVTYWRIHSLESSSQTIPATPMAETIDLSQAGTTRGETATVPTVTLQRRVVTAHVLLPYFSPAGQYQVSIVARRGDVDKVSGQAIASANGIHSDLTVTLDLRGLEPGTYFLSTTHETDSASYFYPIAVR
jgi:hypothetical protein